MFKIDISDRSNPVVVDELSIDGFSSYLHILDDELAFGIGQGSEILTEKITLFNVSEEQVSEIQSIETPNTLFYGVLDPRQILIDKVNNKIIVLATKMFIEEKYVNGEIETEIFLRDAIYLFGYSSDGLVHEVIYLTDFYAKSTDIKREDIITNPRCLIIGDYLYMVSYGVVKSYDIYNNYIEKAVLLLPYQD